MEHFRNAKVVRLLSRHDKYLTADDDDDDGVRQHRSGASRGAKWEVELVEGREDVIRLKSYCFNRYLAASDKRFLLGATGRKVVLMQLPRKAQPQSLGESVEWQPVRDGDKCIKLRTKSGTFLRANGFVKPYGNTVTHGNPLRTVTQDWVLWEVDVLEFTHNASTTEVLTPTAASAAALASPLLSFSSYPGRAVADYQSKSAGVSAAKILAAAASITNRSHRSTNSTVSITSSCLSEEVESTPSPRSVAVDARPAKRSFLSSENVRAVPTAVDQESSSESSSAVSSPPSSPRPPPPTRVPPTRSPAVSPALSRKESSGEGRLIHYHFADDNGEVDDTFPGGSFQFHGSSAKELIASVEKVTDVDEFILCRRNVINDRLYKISLTLPLPPDREPMTVYLVHPRADVARNIT